MDFAQAITSEIGAPITLSIEAQTAMCSHIEANIRALERYASSDAGHDAGPQGADRRRRADNAVELAAQPDCPRRCWRWPPAVPSC